MVVVDRIIGAVRNIYANGGIAVQPGSGNDVVIIITQVHILFGARICSNVISRYGGAVVVVNDNFAGEYQLCAFAASRPAAGSHRALGRIVARNAWEGCPAAGHGEGLAAGHVHRAALAEGKVAGHGSAGHGDNGLVVDRAADVGAVGGEAYARPGDSHIRIGGGVNRAALAALRLSILAGIGRRCISDEAAAFDRG